MKKIPPGFAHCICWFFIGAGILLRLKEFSFNKSLDIDEARIAVDLLARSFPNIIFHQLPYSDLPTLPPGLSLLQKLSVTLLGPAEGVIRLVPLICSLAALVLFERLIVRPLRLPFAWLAVGLFALNDSLITYAASAKQYSSDVLIAVLIGWMYLTARAKIPQVKEILFYGALGFLFMFCSYTAVFGLTAAACALLAANVRNRSALFRYGGLGLIWAGGFVLLYFSYFYLMAGNAYILESARLWVMPRPVFSITTVSWTIERVTRLFEIPLGIKQGWIGLLLCFAGLVPLFKTDRPGFCFFALPLVAVLTAAGFQLYPFFERYLIFLIPYLLVLLAQGIPFLSMFMVRLRIPFLILSVILVFMLPVQGAWQTMTRRSGDDHSYRKVMTFLSARARPDDLVFLNSSSQFPYWYYGYVLGLNKNFSRQPMGKWNNQLLYKHRVGRIFDTLNHDEHGELFSYVRYEMFAYNKEGVVKTKDYADYYAQKVYRLYPDSPFPSKRKQRVWVLFLFVQDDLKKHVVQYFRNKGKQTDGIKFNGSTLYLFEIPGKD